MNLEELNLSAIKFAIKNWKRIQMGTGNAILIGWYRDDDISLDANIKQLLESNRMPFFDIWNP